MVVQAAEKEGYRHVSAFQRQSPQPNPLAQQCTGPTLTPKTLEAAPGARGEREGRSGVEFSMSPGRNFVTLQLWIQPRQRLPAPALSQSRHTDAAAPGERLTRQQCYSF